MAVWNSIVFALFSLCVLTFLRNECRSKANIKDKREPKLCFFVCLHVSTLFIRLLSSPFVILPWLLKMYLITIWTKDVIKKKRAKLFKALSANTNNLYEYGRRTGDIQMLDVWLASRHVLMRNYNNNSNSKRRISTENRMKTINATSTYTIWVHETIIYYYLFSAAILRSSNRLYYDIHAIK